ncbi:hypothetical protein SISNIDRAFT_485068 [Sistotremastrum niveocremeum HHB9708]|uniref:Glucose-methanol-choline oxidoreductase C-terminal domain-containing protein n=1 Tax=Sistotremastrum niveocremeum HHB9708 TaxID=1314777 RepID=A0A164VGI0_9AGAM|nr:hypothetical protein SISNIDRAFT_485068 [Sistotremastrum niveocremeum HHB9708]
MTTLSIPQDLAVIPCSQCSAIAFLRVPSNNSIFQQFPDTATGPGAPHYEFLWRDAWASSLPVTPPATGFFTSVVQVVVAPASRGSITLASADPFTFPIIDPAFLTSEFDVLVARFAFKSVRQFMNATSWQGFNLGLAPDSIAETDEEIDAFLRNNTAPIWHPVGTNRIQSKDGKEVGVVDSKLLVNGVTGLRIVDASVFPFIIGGHPQATVYALAERAADLIKEQFAREVPGQCWTETPRYTGISREKSDSASKTRIHLSYFGQI